MRALVRGLLRVVRFLGWCALLACASAQILEQGGIARRVLAELAGARLASLGGELHLGGLDIDWLRPRLVLRDLRLGEGAPGAARDWLAIERAEVDLRLDPSGLHLRSVHVAGGSLYLNPRLFRGLRALLDEGGTPGEGAPGAPRRFELGVRDLGIVLEAFGEALDLGRIDARLGRDARDVLALEGSVRPPAPPGGAANGAVYLSGTQTGPGVFDLRARASDLVLGPELLPAAGPLAELRALEPRGRLRLAARGRLDLGPERSSGELRLSLDGASLRVPTSPDPIRGLDLELEARYQPEPSQDPWEPRAWRGTARGTCRWRELDLVAGALFGRAARPGAVVEAWARAPAVAFDDALIELSGQRRELLEIVAALAPERASADVRAGLRLREDTPQDAPWTRGLEFVLDAQVAPGTRLAYQGWPSRSGRPEPAFPLPGEVRRGRVVFARAERLVRPDLLVVEGSALHGSGSARILYQGWAPARDTPPFAPGFGRPEMDLVISTPRVAVDAALRRGVEGLGEDPALAGIWDQYGPSGGHAAVALRLAQRVDMALPALDLVVDVEQVDARFSDLPVPVRELSGRVHVRTDGRGGLGVGFDLEGHGADTARVAISGRTRRSQPRGGPERRILEWLAVRARGLQGAGREARILGEILPAVALALEELRPSGPLDLTLERVQGLEDGPLATRLEVWAADLELDPARSPRGARAVAGRALVEFDEQPGVGLEPSAARVRVPGLAGRLPGGARAAWRGTPTELAPGRGSLVVAGLSLGEAAALTGFTPAPEGGVPGLRLAGRVDLMLELDVGSLGSRPDEGGASAPALRALLRDASLAGATGPLIEDLRGALVLEGEQLRAGRLRARFARTELEFLDAVLRPGRGEGAGPELETGLVARGLTLDAEHLSPFLDPTTVHAVLEELEGRGQIDVEAGRLRLFDLLSDEPSAEFEGTLLLSDVTATVGLPVSIRSAGARIERLVVESGGLRVFGRLYDLYGRAAGLELGPANLLVSLVDTRLVVEDLSGTFERGWLRTLGRDSAARPGPALALDLRSPFPFQLALELSGVDVARVLRGVFPANMADRGELDARLRLSGSLERLLEMRGEGALELRRTRLWSIPVFRELFLRLGFDRTLLFDQLSGRFRLVDGRIHLSSLEAKSPIVKLVGSGHVDLDGALWSDLEVRYSLVDKIPTLRRLVYFLQNTLLVVAVRGDLERPEVVLRGEFERIFRPVGKGRRRLPLPAFSALPERF